MTMGALSCAEAEALAPELALGSLDGEERAALLSHLARCARCRELVDQLAQVVDGLLLVAPGAEPPPGFESGVLSGISSRSAPERAAQEHQRPRRGLVAVAAVALVAALAGAGLALLGDADRAGGELHTALAEDDDGRWTCRAVAYGTDPAWLFVALDRRDGANRSYTVELRRAGDAVPVPLGHLILHDGHGSFTTVLQIPAPELHSIRMLDDTGRVRYEAEFEPSS